VAKSTVTFYSSCGTYAKTSMSERIPMRLPSAYYSQRLPLPLTALSMKSQQSAYCHAVCYTRNVFCYEPFQRQV